ncbi:MAG: hypothetical protein ACR2OU_20435, partial [Thermomicrobiales bacterium]
GSAGLKDLGQPLVSVIGYLIGVFPGVDSQSVERQLPEASFGMLAVAAIAFFWYRSVVTPAWQYWDLVEADILSRRERLGTVLAGERSIAVTLFALSSAINLCAAVWSPNLLRLGTDLQRVLPTSQLGEHDSILRWPWQREVLLYSGLWSLQWPYIGIATMVVTFLNAAVIQSSIRSNS